jgi:hypothetical protein
MADQQKVSVIRRKTRAAREGADPRVMSPVRALRLALARAADTLYDLPLVVATVEQRRVEAGEVETSLADEGLHLLLDGVSGARAAMRLDPGLLACRPPGACAPASRTRARRHAPTRRWSRRLSMRCSRGSMTAWTRTVRIMRRAVSISATG